MRRSVAAGGFSIIRSLAAFIHASHPPVRLAPGATFGFAGVPPQAMACSTASAESTSDGPFTTTRARHHTHGVAERMAPGGAASVGPTSVKVPPSCPVVREPSTATLSLNMSMIESDM